MKKYILIFSVITLFLTGYSQSNLYLYNSGNILFQKPVSEIDSIKFHNNISLFKSINDSIFTIPIFSIDSITFGEGKLDTNTSTIVYIFYNDTAVSVINPLSAKGVAVQVAGCDVSVTASSGMQDIEYYISGYASEGSLVITSDKRFILTMKGISLVNSDGPAIEITSDNKVTVNLADNSYNTLIDAVASLKKATFQSEGQVIFTGNGTLNVTANKKNAIFSNDYVKIESGTINIIKALADGIHADYFIMDNGVLNINNTIDDGVDGDEGFIEINGGKITIDVTSSGVKAFKCDSILTVNGGEINLTVSGAASKGFKSTQTMTINGGTINITTSGATVLETSGSGYEPSYCTALKSESNIVFNGGTCLITSTSTSDGGKGISADSNIIINNGTITITTAGNGATYTCSADTIDTYSAACMKSDGKILINGGTINCTSSGIGGKGISANGIITLNNAKVDVKTTGNGTTYTTSRSTTDSYTAACLKSDADINLLSGNITCTSTGTGGKGIAADKKIIIGVLNANNDSLVLTVNTSGERFYVSGTTGGGGPNDNADYANPKAIKGVDNVVINSGTITVTCTQTNEGGEGIECKDTLIINGGNIEVKTYDDCINSAKHLVINGGTTYCYASNNDGIDCNGTFLMTGGLTVACGTRAPEEGFDCDQNAFKITGGTFIGTGGATSTPTSSLCTQRTVLYTGTAGNAICIKNSSGTEILTYQMPTYSTTGGGGGPGGGNTTSMILFYSSPNLSNATYTIYYGGTISGGTNYHGYYTGSTFSGGSTKSFTISSMVTTVK